MHPLHGFLNISETVIVKGKYKSKQVVPLVGIDAGLFTCKSLMVYDGGTNFREKSRGVHKYPI